MRRVLNDSDIDRLAVLVRPYLSESRYGHTLAVEKEARVLGGYYLPDEVNRLRAAALLHDITKSLGRDAQLKCCMDFDIILDNYKSSVTEILHAITGAELAKREFPDYTDDGIIDGIRYHTTGRDGMSVFEAVIYLADFIEETRRHESCRQLRSYFYENIDKAGDRKLLLAECMIRSIDSTITYLVSRGTIIDADTVGARNFFLDMMRRGTCSEW